MNSITINSISLISPNYQIYVCDVYGNNCVFTALVPNPIPPSITIFSPPQFANSGAVGVKIINDGNCENFEIILCESLIPYVPTPTQTPTMTVTPTQTPTSNIIASQTPTQTPTRTQTPSITPTKTPTPTPTRPGTKFNRFKGKIGCNTGGNVTFTLFIPSVPFNFYISLSSSFSSTAFSIQLYQDMYLTTPVNSVTTFVVNSNEIWMTDSSGLASFANYVGDTC